MGGVRDPRVGGAAPSDHSFPAAAPPPPDPGPTFNVTFDPATWTLTWACLVGNITVTSCAMTATPGAGAQKPVGERRGPGQERHFPGGIRRDGKPTQRPMTSLPAPTPLPLPSPNTEAAGMPLPLPARGTAPWSHAGGQRDGWGRSREPEAELH